MTRTLLAALLVGSAASTSAQTIAPQVRQLQQAALQDEHAWDVLEGLTTEVGPRLAGTEAEARARDW